MSAQRIRCFTALICLLGWNDILQADTPDMYDPELALRPEGAPKFSWDKVPLNAHFGISNGLTSDEYQFLAETFDFITITAGPKKGDDYTSAELYTAEAAKEIKKRNPDATVIFYWASDKPKFQSKITNDTYPGDYYPYSESKGSSVRRGELFDLRRQEVLDWWSDAAGAAIHKYGCDGIYVDGATSGTKNGKYQRLVKKEYVEAFQQGNISMLKSAKLKMGEDKLVLYNPLHPGGDTHELLKYTDGAMIDKFNRIGSRPQSPEEVLSMIELLRDTSRSGKIITFKAWPDFAINLRKNAGMLTEQQAIAMARKDMTFSLASFLIGAEVNSYFNYSWGWTIPEGTFVSYPEYDKRLGAPQAPFVRDGWKLTREFEHASVFVDLETREAKIDWR